MSQALRAKQLPKMKDYACYLIDGGINQLDTTRKMSEDKDYKAKLEFKIQLLKQIKDLIQTME